MSNKRKQAETPARDPAPAPAAAPEQPAAPAAVADPDPPVMYAGPPFLAVEYIFASESNNRKVVYTATGAPAPAAPVGYPRLLGVTPFPFESEAERARMIG